MFILLAPNTCDQRRLGQYEKYINSKTDEQVILLPNSTNKWGLLWPKERHKKRIIKRLIKHCTE